MPSDPPSQADPPPQAGQATPAGPASPAGRGGGRADADVLLREGIASLLSGAGYTVAGQAGDAGTLLSVVRAARPDLVIADIRMPPTQSAEGIEVARVIRGEFPDIGI